MRTYLATALMAISAYAQIQPPDSQWPSDWVDGTSGSFTWPSHWVLQELDMTFQHWFLECINNPTTCRPRRAYCRMQTNPAYRTTNPYGGLELVQFGPSSPVFIWGGMRRLPYNNSYFGFSIN